MNWLHYINSELSVTTDHIQVDGEEKVVVYAPEYLQKLNILLDDLRQTDEGKTYLYLLHTFNVHSLCVKRLHVYGLCNIQMCTYIDATEVLGFSL